MRDRLDGKVAVITGGASGLGAAMARRFVHEGANVVLVDRQVDAGRAVATNLGDGALFLAGDVTVEDDLAAAVNLAVDRWGHLDVMCNNAGFGGASGPVTELTGDDYDTTMGVLLKSVVMGTKHAARVMVPQGSGSIISTSSVCGMRAGIGPHLYSTAKAAVIMLTQSVALELAEHAIRVNCICPGYVATPLLGAARLDRHGPDVTAQRIAAASDELASTQPLGRTGEPDDIAATAAFLASDDSRWITGTAHVVDGGLLAGLPWRQQPPLLTTRRGPTRSS
jgi:NAD(P)-dependent dehydrogenase (short-subunit alcohol dehydrogenase family)